ncbi:hypothetical protein N483_06275 [Pseudoalteromonas luteoviolacea NCIMB 1944]|uniref:Uncharacterized protein n=1 Tax=Pseudoalteromonas luteoviolacea (strain 2ta16) TaxID=1353533 RepID=V4HK48_PSEL2|nr:hypothetical protein PL2TA16_01086 [Pseudoalteromonas luteoviolacea 2ta16]KZN31418.1 hypothetical protein N483_06275 [Pseudoalteromonas luteoviolacea NCIMB 1944]
MVVNYLKSNVLNPIVLGSMIKYFVVKLWLFILLLSASSTVFKDELLFKKIYLSVISAMIFLFIFTVLTLILFPLVKRKQGLEELAKLSSKQRGEELGKLLTWWA